jgi:hypothetical protein
MQHLIASPWLHKKVNIPESECGYSRSREKPKSNKVASKFHFAVRADVRRRLDVPVRRTEKTPKEH